MRLFEEYFNRHDIKSVPLVHHAPDGAVILESLKDSSFKILVLIEWKNEKPPGRYVIQSVSPIHNGFSSGSFFKIHNEVEKKWHEYESYFIEFAENLQELRVISNEKEVLLAAWEMFVFIHDGWLSGLPLGIKDALFESVNKENSFEERYEKYQDVYYYLGHNFPYTLENWQKYILFRVVGAYSFWFANLINKVPSLKG